VPESQVTYWTALAPNRKWRSKRPSPRLAIAHDESTTVCPCAARRNAEPGSDGASAMPIGRKRVFISAAAPIAAPTPPPAAMIEIAANCADPAKTNADMTSAPTAEKPASRASTPKVMASTPPATA
jgi:hypothetical protein